MRCCVVLLFAVLLMQAQPPDKGRQIVDEAVDALGGPKFLSMKTRTETGRAYSFYRAELSGLSIATIYTEYLDHPAPQRLAIRERQAFGKKQDYSVLFLEDGGFELTFRGARPLPDDRWKRYSTTAATNVFYLLRERLNEPKMSYDFVRSDVVLNTQVNIVDITDPDDHTVRVYFDLNTKLPIRQEYSDWDPIGQQRSTETTDYSKFLGDKGVQWPYVVHRSRNGEVQYEIFSDRVEIDPKLPEKTFAVPEGMRVLKKVD